MSTRTSSLVFCLVASVLVDGEEVFEVYSPIESQVISNTINAFDTEVAVSGNYLIPQVDASDFEIISIRIEHSPSASSGHFFYVTVPGFEGAYGGTVRFSYGFSSDFLSHSNQNEETNISAPEGGIATVGFTVVDRYIDAGSLDLFYQTDAPLRMNYNLEAFAGGSASGNCPRSYSCFLNWQRPKFTFTLRRINENAVFVPFENSSSTTYKSSLRLLDGNGHPSFAEIEGIPSDFFGSTESVVGRQA